MSVSHWLCVNVNVNILNPREELQFKLSECQQRRCSGEWWTQEISECRKVKTIKLVVKWSSRTRPVCFINLKYYSVLHVTHQWYFQHFIPNRAAQTGLRPRLERGDQQEIRILDKKSFGTFFYFSIISSCLALKCIILNNSRKELYRIICISIMKSYIVMHRCKIIEKSNVDYYYYYVQS